MRTNPPPPTDVAAAILRDQSLVLISPSGMVWQGNHTAASMWHALQRTRNPDQAAVIVARQYDAPIEVVRRDLHELIMAINQAGIKVPQP